MCVYDYCCCYFGVGEHEPRASFMGVRPSPPGYIPYSCVFITKEAKSDKSIAQYSLHDYEEIVIESMKAVNQKD